MVLESPEKPAVLRLDEEFQGLRGALLAHCYRMVGSYDDAEDLVHETYIRARRGIEGFEERSSLKTWLYRIATNTCLSARQSRHRRVLPSGLGAPNGDPHAPTPPDPSAAWVQPLPDALWQPDPLDPSEVVALRESVRLAMIATLQYLPPRQRAVFLLREVLEWPAADVATAMEISVPAVKSLLQRARARIAEVQPGPALESVQAARERDLLERYMRAFETSDIHAIEAIIHDDFSIEVPPSTVWFKGKATCLPFLKRQALGRPGDWRLRATRVNGQPAAASYNRDEYGRYRAFCLCVLDVEGDKIQRVTVFKGPAAVVAAGFESVLADNPN